LAHKAAAAEFPGVQAGIDYAELVVRGDIDAGRYAKWACERFLRDLQAAKAKTSPWEFNPAKAEAPIVFAGLLSNIKGPAAGSALELMDYQKFWYANVFGFYARGTEARRFRQASIWVPRGNGKTTGCSPVTLYASFCEGEGGAEGYTAAVTRDQARILFDSCKEMARRSPEFRGEYGVEVMANSIYQDRTASKLIPVSSDAKALDGLNVHIAVCDEIGSHKTAEVYDVLLTALGKRLNPLLVSISTATSNTVGIGKQLWDYGVRVLSGQQVDDRFFALIYTIDDTDDPWDEATWRKANPGWGVTVQPDAFRAIMVQARNNPAQESFAQSRHLNIWRGSDEALFSIRAWKSCANAELSLDAMEGCECHLGLDLASKVDLACLSLVFPGRAEEMKLRYDVFGRNYVNEAAILEARYAAYPGWAADGYLTVTEGNETDFSRIEDDLLEFMRRFRILSVAYDPWAATQFAQRMIAQDVPMVEFRATTQNFSEPCKELEAAMRSNRIAHDGDPVLEWCIGNVVGRYDARGNVYPKKARPENKIDAAMAAIMAIARCMAAQEQPSVYAERGILTIG
jgi:phage terminase large subunit-like protein